MGPENPAVTDLTPPRNSTAEIATLTAKRVMAYSSSQGPGTRTSRRFDGIPGPMSLIAELRCESCGHESNALVDRLFPLGRHPCPECAGLKRVVSLIRDRRTRDIPVEDDRRIAGRPAQRVAESA